MDVQKTTLFHRFARTLFSGLAIALTTTAIAAPEPQAGEPAETERAPAAAPATLPPTAALVGPSPTPNGELRVVLHHSLHPFTSIEVICPEFDLRERAAFARRATFSQNDPRLDAQTWPFEARISIPSAGTCELYLKGGPPAKIASVGANSELHCSADRSQVRCTTIPLL